MSHGRVTPQMVKAAWLVARRWWPKQVVQYHKCAACKQAVGLRVLETSISVDEPTPGFREAIEAALAIQSDSERLASAASTASEA